jgi:translocator protein
MDTSITDVIHGTLITFLAIFLLLYAFIIKMKHMYQYAIAVSMVSVATTAFLGSYFTNKSVKSKWYDCIKPKITPPPTVFPIVWTALYGIIAFAFAYALIKYPNDKELAMWFGFNLLLNVVWCYMYFYAREIHFALLFMITLWISIVTIMYKSKDRYIQGAMLPYLVWITFAMVLNSLSTLKVKECEDVM